MVSQACNQQAMMNQTTRNIRLTQQTYSLDLQQTVDFMLNKPKFGMENYNPENMPDHLQSPRHFKSPRSRRDTFAVSVPKVTKNFPPVGQYETSYDWKTRRPEV